MSKIDANEALSDGELLEQVSKLPEDVLILIPVRNLVLFPGVVQPVAIGRTGSIAAAAAAVEQGRRVGLLLQRDGAVDEPGEDDLYRIGTEATIRRYVKTSDTNQHIVVQGERRFRVLDFVPGLPFLAARIEALPDQGYETPEVEARGRVLKARAIEAVRLLPQAPAEMVQAIESIPSAAALADLTAGFLDIDSARKQRVLECEDVDQRLSRVIELLEERLEVLRLTQEINEQTRASVDERQREALLREQMRTIRKELGEEGDESELDELEAQIRDAGMPEAAEDEALKELKRLRRTPEQGGEHAMIRTWLDWMVSLPWAPQPAQAIDLAAARDVLEADHYGLDKIKRRILEHLAVRSLNPDGKSPILCFVGPPGVGKTSLGRSVARAIGAEFARVSLGGVHDESEIRGHRRTYVGAMPGNIVQNLRKAGSNRPLFMLDEVDKLGRGFHGDPSAALLEVLDPEQNGTFRDNYLGVDFDLSKVFFIATANRLDTIPGPLRDRMEVIELAGYTDEEKLQIARRYLVERQLDSCGLTAEQVSLTDAALERVVRDYTREAGCRNLERQIGSVLRFQAMRIAEGHQDPILVQADEIPAILGPRLFDDEVALRTSVPGVATGLAWTPVGGEVLFIEAARLPGSGKLILTGQLGDVMKESAQAALSLLKARADRFGLEKADFDGADIHVHIPAGAIPKDGPSAGVTLYSALVSLFTGRVVSNDVAMTGEISLRGLVLPVGGIKEKVVAAARAGVKRVLLPARNRKDYEDIPESARDALEFEWIEDVDQLFGEAFAAAESAPASEAVEPA